MASTLSRTAFIFGCGYLGIRVARLLLADDWHVAAMTRSRDRARILASENIEPILGEWTDSRSIAQVPQADRVLFAVGYDGRSGHSRHDVYVEGLRQALHSVSPAARTVYVSSTGVYHQTDGRWVDEYSPTHPTREGGRAHLRAESLLRRRRPYGYGSGRDVVLRMAGLYGPDRVPHGESIRRGNPIPADGQGFLNLIHIDDAARGVLAAWEHPDPLPMYVVADGHPVLRGEYYREIARILRADEPRFVSAHWGRGGEGRSASSKRIWAARCRRDLLPRPMYPSYREGLRSVLA